MTEQHSSFGGLAVADPRSAPATDDFSEDIGEDNNRRKLAVVGAVVAVLVILVAAFFLMKGKGGTTAAPAAPHPAQPATSTSKSAGAAAHAAKPVRLPKAFAGTVGRDPFKALYVQPVKADATGSGGSTTPTTTTPGSTTPPTVTPTGTDPGTTTGTGTTVTTAPVFRPVWIRLVSLTPTKAKFDVGFSNHKTLKVKHFALGKPSSSSPEVFARNFAVLRLSGSSVVLQYGDGSPFALDIQHPLMIVN